VATELSDEHVMESRWMYKCTGADWSTWRKRTDRVGAHAPRGGEQTIDSAAHAGDVSAADEAASEDFTEAALNATVLQQVRDALRRNDDGMYGRCLHLIFSESAQRESVRGRDPRGGADSAGNTAAQPDRARPVRLDRALPAQEATGRGMSPVTVRSSASANDSGFAKK